jgi:hypothetical protein
LWRGRRAAKRLLSEVDESVENSINPGAFDEPGKIAREVRSRDDLLEVLAEVPRSRSTLKKPG